MNTIQEHVYFNMALQEFSIQDMSILLSDI